MCKEDQGELFGVLQLITHSLKFENQKELFGHPGCTVDLTLTQKVHKNFLKEGPQCQKENRVPWSHLLLSSAGFDRNYASFQALAADIQAIFNFRFFFLRKARDNKLIDYPSPTQKKL